VEKRLWIQISKIVTGSFRAALNGASHRAQSGLLQACAASAAVLHASRARAGPRRRALQEEPAVACEGCQEWLSLWQA